MAAPGVSLKALSLIGMRFLLVFFCSYGHDGTHFRFVASIHPESDGNPK